MTKTRDPLRPRRLPPDPGTPAGVVLYAVIAGVIIWAITAVLSHIVISWR